MTVGVASLPHRERLRAALASHQPRGASRRFLPTTRSAAVLVALVADPPGVLLTRRAATMRRHAGQVAFPGGVADPADADAEATALREAEEEIGLDPADVEIIGRLPETFTGTDFCVTPVVGLVETTPEFRLAPDEVDCVFLLPLAVLLDPAAPQRREALFDGEPHSFWVWPHEEQYIWGATAGVLVELAAVLADAV